MISLASRNGVVGIKPTVGLVSSDGLIPLAIKHASQLLLLQCACRRACPDQLFSFGIIFAGNPFSERVLLCTAYEFEQLTRVRDTLTPFNPPKTDLSDLDLRVSDSPPLSKV